MKKEHPIFSGEYSRDMWEAINSAKTKGDLRRALYFVCCRLQELESRLTKDALDPPSALVCTCAASRVLHEKDCPLANTAGK